LKTIKIQDAIVGMYVVAVTKQQGNVQMTSEGWIRTEAVLQQLKAKGVLELQIDPSKQLPTAEESQAAEPVSAVPAAVTHPGQPKVKLGPELNKAKHLYKEARDLQRKAFDDIASGKTIDAEPFRQCAEGFIESVFRNQDALLCMSRIRDKDAYLLEHSVNVSILMTVFAKHLQLAPEVIEQLATGALLHDIGKIKVPDQILHKPGKLSDDEFVVMREHVVFSREILKQTAGISAISLDVAAAHHERLDGRGYPLGLTAPDISLYARMIAIVDTYDAITAKRVYKEGQTCLNALKILRKDSGTMFDAELVGRFIGAVGIYPPGTLVRLKSQKVGLVTETNWDDATKPKLKTFYHAKFARYIEVQELDLASNKIDDAIEAVVKPEDYGIDLPKFFNSVLAS
jgi:putative nucleotidyltransferase with HDIG domain